MRNNTPSPAARRAETHQLDYDLHIVYFRGAEFTVSRKMGIAKIYHRATRRKIKVLSDATLESAVNWIENNF